ncbi:hypothetical protein CLU79DRAFT_890085 [Phycomyces nitens]|nr:hypothetical protein CLU79DRAFT_890085 [Phycomyces nitens]
MASTLPPNIVSYIGTFIDDDERLACTLVCKHWTEPFLDAYWGRLYIGRNTMDITTFISNKSFLINSHRVWAVDFRVEQLNDYEYFTKYQQFLQGIRYLRFYDKISDISTLLKTFDWILWQSLTHLDIFVDSGWESLSSQNLFMKLSVLPCLVRLRLEYISDVSRRPIFSWNEFESMHHHLPRLEYLEHGFVLKPITRDEIESTKKVKPAQTMKTIKLKDQVDTRWLFYFALKYPNLQHLSIQRSSLQSDYNPIDYTNQQYRSNFQLFSTLDQFFPCLKMAATVLDDKNMYLWFIFFETLGHFSTKIEHVDLFSEDAVKQDDLDRYIHPISESLKVLRISSMSRHAVMPFVVCPRLVTLRISGVFDSRIDADTILEYFPALRSLSVRYVHFYLSTNPHTYTPHPLQKLKIEHSEINNDALHYVSICCNQLKHVKFLYLDSMVYDAKDDDGPGQQIFDMSMSNLDTFIFTFADELPDDLKLYPKHYVIEQMDNDNNGLQTTQQSPRINWYHVYCDRTNRKEKILEWELGRRDIEFCQRYLEDFDRRKKRGKEREDIKKGRLGYTQKRFWKKDLQHGVVVFRFKSVKSHFFRIKTTEM